MILIIPLLITLALSFNAEAYDKNFEPTAWSESLHLFSGAGFNSSIFSSEETRVDAGIGLNIRADLGYYFNDHLAFEVGSSVKFNRVNGFLIWDTLITGGLRYRFRNEFFDDRSYGRIFFGRSPTVVYFNGNAPEEYRESGASRVQFDGPAGGIAFGITQKLRDQQIWFFEITASLQHLEQHDGIVMDGEVPIVIFSGPEGDKTQIWSLYASFGILLF